MNSAAACDGRRSPRSCRKSRHWRRADCGMAARTNWQCLPHDRSASRVADRERAEARQVMAEMEYLLAMLQKLPLRSQLQAQRQADCCARFLEAQEAAWSADASARSRRAQPQR